LVARRERVVGVSPIIAGRPVKGPADRLMGPLGIDGLLASVSRASTGSFCSTLVIDSGDAGRAAEIEALGVHAVAADTLMTDAASPPAPRARRSPRSPEEWSTSLRPSPHGRHRPAGSAASRMVAPRTCSP